MPKAAWDLQGDLELARAEVERLKRALRQIANLRQFDPMPDDIDVAVRIATEAIGDSSSASDQRE